MSGQFAAKQERARVAPFLIEELRGSGRIAALIASFKTNGLGSLLSLWAAGETMPATAEQVQRALKGDQLVEELMRKTNMPLGVVKTSLTVLLPLTVRQLSLDGQLSADGTLAGLPLEDTTGLVAALA